MDKIKWIFVEHITDPLGYDFNVYQSEDGKYCKNVWDDGIEEIYENA